MAVMISVGATVAKVSLPVTLYSHIYDSMLLPLVRIWPIRRARALQGQRLEAKE